MLTAVNILLKSFVCLEENLQGEIYQIENLKTDLPRIKKVHITKVYS